MGVNDCLWKAIARAALCAWGLAIPGTACVAATVELEVTQGIQYFKHVPGGTNTIELVSGRRTVVRAKIDVDLMMRTLVDVKGSLSVVSVPPPPPPGPRVWPPSDYNRIKVRDFLISKAPWDRNETNHTLNFIVDDLPPGNWDFTAKIELAFAAPDPIETGSGTATLTAVEVIPIAIHLVPLRFYSKTQGPIGPPDPVELDLSYTRTLLQACFPLSDKSLITWEPAHDLPPHDHGCADRIDTKGGPKNDVDMVLNELSSLAATTVPEPHFYYGFCEPHPPTATSIIRSKDCKLAYMGWGKCDARVGFGTANLGIAGKVLAHEIGHLFALDHCILCSGYGPPCDLDSQVGFDVFLYGEEPASPATRPYTKHFSMMRCGPIPSTEVWVPPSVYKHCQEVLKVGSPESFCTSDGIVSDPATPRPFILQGAVTSDGSAISWLDPAFLYPWSRIPRAQNAGGEYEVVALDDKEKEIVGRHFNADLRAERVQGGADTARGFFRVVLPIPPGRIVAHLRFLRNGAQIHTETRTLDVPAITLQTPPVGDNLQQPTMVQWAVVDSDTPGNEILRHVVYSPDKGLTFKPVAVNLTSDAPISFDPADFDSSLPGQGLLRVIVSDGLNTHFEDIGQLTVN